MSHAGPSPLQQCMTGSTSQLSVAILAGGRATRLESVVADRPKGLAVVCGRPFMAWLLDYLARSGVRSVVLCTGHLASQFETTLGSSWQGMAVKYSIETSPLGTGGALRHALPHLRSET